MVRHYLRTLIHVDVHGERRVNPAHAAVQIGVPIIGAIALLALGVRLNERGNVISLISIVTGLMCTVAALLFEARTSTLRSDVLTTNRDESSVDELFYLCCWLIVVGILGTLFLLLPDLDYPVAFPTVIHDAYSGVCFAIVLHFSMVMASFATRFVRIYVRIAEHRD